MRKRYYFKLENQCDPVTGKTQPLTFSLEVISGYLSLRPKSKWTTSLLFPKTTAQISYS